MTTKEIKKILREVLEAKEEDIENKNNDFVSWKEAKLWMQKGKYADFGFPHRILKMNKGDMLQYYDNGKWNDIELCDILTQNNEWILLKSLKKEYYEY